MTLTLFASNQPQKPAASAVTTALLGNGARAMDFHRRLPGYQPTQLLESCELGHELGLDSLMLKLELQRFGLPSFKFLGAAYAAYRAVVREIGFEPDWQTLEQLGAVASSTRALRLTTATDGNHGRAIARFARLIGVPARIYVPTPTALARIAAIRIEGAEVVIVDDDYDAAVRLCAFEAEDFDIIVSDTSWDGYEQTPRDVVDGYQTIFAEIDQELKLRQALEPTSVVVPVGVGGLAAAAAQWLAKHWSDDTRLVIVEPSTAACVTAALISGSIVTLADSQRSSMAGLNCGTASAVALELLGSAVSGSITVTDSDVETEMIRLAGFGIDVGESGAAGVAGVAKTMASSPAAALDLLGSRPLVVITEGATDPANFQRIVGRQPRTDATGT